MIKEKGLPLNVLQRLPGLIESLRACEDVIALFFFGGLARRELKPLSDLDFAVLLKGHSNRGKMLDRQLDLMGFMARELATEEFDLIILNTAPLRFSHHILRNGRRIFVKDPQRLGELQERVVKKYLDFLHYRREFDRAFLGVWASMDERILDHLKPSRGGWRLSLAFDQEQTEPGYEL